MLAARLTARLAVATSIIALLASPLTIASDAGAATTSEGAAVGRWERVIPGAVGNPTAVSGSPEDYTDAFVGTTTGLVHQRFRVTGQSTQNLGGILRSDPHAVSTATGTYVFVIGADDGVWYRLIDVNGSAGPWLTLGGIAHRRPTAVATPTGDLRIFVVGADEAVWTRRMVGASWSSWERVGGIATTGIAASSSTDYDIVFVRGTDGALWQANNSGGQWRPFYSMRGSIVGSPSTDAQFVRGTDNQVYIRSSTWQFGWNPTSGFIAGDPTSTWTRYDGIYSRGLAVFGRGPDGAAWALIYERRGSTGWFSLGGNISSTVAAASWGEDVECACRGLRVYAVAPDGALYTKLI